MDLPGQTWRLAETKQFGKGLALRAEMLPERAWGGFFKMMSRGSRGESPPT